MYLVKICPVEHPNPAERYLKKIERENLDPNTPSSGHASSIPSKSPSGDDETNEVLKRLHEEKKIAEDRVRKTTFIIL